MGLDKIRCTTAIGREGHCDRLRIQEIEHHSLPLFIKALEGFKEIYICNWLSFTAVMVYKVTMNKLVNNKPMFLIETQD